MAHSTLGWKGDGVTYRDWRAGYGSSIRVLPILGIIAVLGLGALVLLAGRNEQPDRVASSSSAGPQFRPVGSGTAPTRPDVVATSLEPVITALAAGDVPSTDPPATPTEPSATLEATTTEAPTTTAAAVETTAPAPVATVAVTPTPEAAAPPGTATPPTPAPAPAPAPFDTLPDGSPVPVVAVFDVSTVTLTGVVPTDADIATLGGLAMANSKFPDATLVNQLTTNPAVPRDVGVRVIELTSSRFPEGSFEILPDHAAELDRVVQVMELLPNVSVTVVGHSDQRGAEDANYRLSADRAAAVVDYMVARGIQPSRLSSRAVGEADLLTLADDEAALALNRRTEFVFYGLLLG